MQIEIKQRLVGFVVVILLFLLCLPIFLNRSRDKVVAASSVGNNDKQALVALPSQSGPIHFQLPAQGVKGDNLTVAAISGSSAQPGSVDQKRVTRNNKKQLVNSNSLPSTLIKNEIKTVKVSPAITLTERSVKKIVYINKKKTSLPGSTSLKSLNNKSVSSRVLKKRWVLQVASFHNDSNARKLLQRLRTKGYNSYLKEAAYKGGRKVVKVLVGPYRSRSTLLRYQQRVAQQFKLNGIVRQHQI